MPPARQFQERWQVPMVAQFHTLAQLKNRVAHDDAEREYQERLDLERVAMAAADRVIALSPADRRQMVEHYGGCVQKIELIPGGVDLRRFAPGSRCGARQRLGLPPDAAIILFVGRIQRLKGIEVLIRAAAELHERGCLSRPLLVLIVGGQPAGGASRTPEQREIARLQQLASRLGLDDVVRFVGAVPQAQLPLYYRAAEATVMPSSYESFGLVAAESMACGTPVVASQVGGLRSLVRDGQTGYLIPWRNPTLFAEKLGDLLRQPDLGAVLGRNAVAAMASFGWSAAADRLLTVYDELLTTRRQAAYLGQPSSS
jgi:D-inositol-3-phosphate glycosyltransferase